jgi:probable phosphomutase (TIGR03848 family)
MPAILLIRHGDNEPMKKYLVGRTPGIHLNEQGQKQAKSLVEQLAQAPIQAVYSSPMERAVETALPLAQARQLEIQVKPGLNELDYGDWRGRTYKQLARTNAWKQLKIDPTEVHFPQGESLCAAQERARLELEALAAVHEDKDLIACVTHGDIIRLLVAYYLEMPLKAYQKLTVFTASVTVMFLSKENHAHLLHMNQVTGLDLTPPPEKKKK